MSFGLSRGKTLDVGDVGIDMRGLPSFEEGRIDPRSWFKNSDAPFEIEIGSGKGTFLLQESQQRVEPNYLGFEWAAEFYRYAADRIRRNHILNVKMVHGDATEFLRFWCEDNVADVLHLYFSDPWPKTRHHKRRVIQDATLKTFHRVLKPGGILHVVTDHEDLWNWCDEHFARNTTMFTKSPFSASPSASDGELVGTNFERKYRTEGRPFFATTLNRVN
jgi:tRNA (guanine-N7-)-methyltransferase